MVQTEFEEVPRDILQEPPSQRAFLVVRFLIEKPGNPAETLNFRVPVVTYRESLIGLETSSCRATY
jgi:hypothetical protein